MKIHTCCHVASSDLFEGLDTLLDQWSQEADVTWGDALHTMVRQDFIKKGVRHIVKPFEEWKEDDVVRAVEQGDSESLRLAHQCSMLLRRLKELPEDTLVDVEN